jgi:hypothetical protein
MRLTYRRLLLVVAAGTFLSISYTPPAHAQVPPDWYVVSSFIHGSLPQWGQDWGGLWFVNPRTPQAPIRVTGLGLDLTGFWSPGAILGTYSVRIRPSDGALIAGEIGAWGTAIDLHVITLNGSAAVSDTTYFVGIASTTHGGGITQTALLPNGDILVAVDDLSSGPLGNRILGIVSPSTGTVTPLPGQWSFTGRPQGLALALSGTTAYLALQNPNNATASIYSIPLPQGEPATLVATVPAQGSDLDVDASGMIHIATFSGVFTVNPANGAVTSVPSPAWLSGLAVEPGTGNYALVETGVGGRAMWMTPTGEVHILTSASWGFPSSIDVNTFATPALLGDLNCDGVVNFGDIDPFVLALSDPAAYQGAYPNCNVLNGDCNGDTYVDFGDIDPFVALLSG